MENTELGLKTQIKTDSQEDRHRHSGRNTDRDTHRHRDSQSELPTDLH